MGMGSPECFCGVRWMANLVIVSDCSFGMLAAGLTGEWNLMAEDTNHC